jgi:CRISPR/Cas system CSM-associated protein Csm3 (group 7 of RAMP superfamily)
MNAPRYLFIGELRQNASASFGGQAAEGWIDAPLCRDGLGRPTLRGEGQAGALLAMARKLFREVPAHLGGVMNRQPSAWRTYASHPDPAILSGLRQCVRIDPQTAAASHGALFDMETLPSGTRWPFLLELDLKQVPEASRRKALAVTARVLQAWADGYAWLGRNVARGMGWFTLEDLLVLELGDADLWPNAFTASPYAYAKQLGADRWVKLPDFIDQKQFADKLNGVPVDGAGRWRRYEAELRFDADKDYPFGALSVGGHAGYDTAPACPGDDVLLCPEGMARDQYTAQWEPDRSIATAPDLLPYIPGSSLRGPLRHRLSWWLKRLGNPPDGEVFKDFKALFGNDEPTGEPGQQSLAPSSALFIRDAFIDAGKGYRLALLPSHAEDEFSGGTYGNALYNRLAVLGGVFKTRLVLQASPEKTLDDLDAIFKPARLLAEKGYIPIGGASRHGFGHGRWEFGVPVDCGGSW